MARGLKPYKVDRVYHNGDISTFLDIFFDREKMVFFASMATERVEAKSVNELIPLAKELLSRSISFVWEPVIVVGVPSKDDSFERHSKKFEFVTAIAEFRFRRSERSKKPGGAYYERMHQLDFNKRMERWRKKGESRFVKSEIEDRANNRDLSTMHLMGDEIVLPYTEESWKGLHAIVNGFRQLRINLEKICRSKHFEDHLRAVATGRQPLQLTAGKKT